MTQDAPHQPPQPPQPPQSGIQLDDIYFVVFRRKWLILSFFLIGLIAAAGIYFTQPPKYRSTAKLLVRYVVDIGSLNPATDASEVKRPDSRGDSIINSEIQILTSWDLAFEVAQAVGPDVILGEAGLQNAETRATGKILKNLEADSARNSTVIVVSFVHEDPMIARNTLEQLVTHYMRKHMEIHRSIGTYDFLTQQTDQLRSSLMQTEDQLRNLKNEAGVLSVESSKEAITEEISTINLALFEAETQLAQRQAEMKALGQWNDENDTNAVPEEVSTEEPEQFAYYQRITERLNTLQVKELDYLAKYTDDNPMVTGLRDQIAETKKKKKELEQENPALARYGNVTSSATSSNSPNARGPVSIASLEAKINVLTARLEQARTRAAEIEQLEAKLEQLQRKKKLDEANYSYFTANLEQAKIDNALESGKVNNISVVQQASPSGVASEKILKKVAMALAAGVFGGIGLAFLLEWYVVPSVKRPKEITNSLKLPLSLSIPDLTPANGTFPKPKNGRRLFRRKAKHSLLETNGDSETEAADSEQSDSSTEIAEWDAKHRLRPYHEALRDRMVMYFEQGNMTHRPKLIGLTSCRKGSGVTTLSSGLAATLSETGEGKVLLVDLTANNGSVHPFFHGKPACGLMDIFENGHNDSAKVQEHLYVASAEGVNGHSVQVRSKKFAELMPKMKASDYDYIIFDMPPVDQTSVTCRLSGFMDVSLMVIQSDTVKRENVQHAVELMGNAQSKISTILNRTRSYVPEWLHEEI